MNRPGDENFPILVENLSSETIIRVACGDGQTLAVSTAGDVWGWGTYKDKEGKTWFNPSSGSNKIKIQQREPIKIMVCLAPFVMSSHFFFSLYLSRRDSLPHQWWILPVVVPSILLVALTGQSILGAWENVVNLEEMCVS
jgi:hypothetical protein